jgi:hypothetical protein
LFLGAHAARAQNVPRTPAERSSNPALPPIRLPNVPRITDRLPYTQWNRHLGPAADALVTAEVALKDSRTQEVTTQLGVGLVVRCDGLVLLPACLFYTPGNADRTRLETVQSVTLHARPLAAAPQGTLTTQPAPTALTFAADVPRYRSPKAAFVLVKTRDQHFRAAALLHPRNLSSSRTVEVVYPGFPVSGGDSPARALARATVRVIEKPDGVVGLTFASGDNSAMPKLPPGAILIDTESKMAVGIYAPPEVPVVSTAGEISPASEKYLATFASLHEVTNAIGLVPKPDDRLSEAPHARKPGEAQEGMVWIPGGPREIRPTDWQELQGAVAACMPGFWIDRTEVTVREFRTFLQATGYRPQGQIPPGSTVPLPPDGKPSANPEANPDDLPIRGVTAADAEAYAAWAGKRLVTPLEWMWATLGAGLAPPPPIPAALIQPNKDPETELPQLQPTDMALRNLSYRASNWIRSSTPPWPDAYERLLNDSEITLRTTALIRAFEESEYWGYWQAPANPGRSFPGDKVPPNYQTTEFIAAVNYLTPSRAVLDPRPFQVPVYSGNFVSVGGATVVDTVQPSGLRTQHGFSFTLQRSAAMKEGMAILDTLFDPLRIAPVGSRIYDRSLFDVRDVGTNLPEWIQENRAVRPSERVEKVLPPLFDPVAEPNWRQIFEQEMARRMARFNVDLNGGDRFNLPAVLSYLSFPNAPLRTNMRKQRTVLFG